LGEVVGGVGVEVIFVLFLGVFLGDLGVVVVVVVVGEGGLKESLLAFLFSAICCLFFSLASCRASLA
jgi:hypothetical protein